MNQSDPLSQPPNRKRGSLGRRMALLVATAMLPLGALSVMQTRSLQAEIDARSELALNGQTIQAGEPLLQMIRKAEATAQTLSLFALDMAQDNARCSDWLATIARNHPEYSLVAFIPSDGLMLCSSSGKPHDFSTNPLFPKLIGPDGPSFLVNRAGPVSGTSVLGVVHPVRDAAGVKRGVLSISIPHSDLTALAPAQNNSGDEPIILATFDASGTLLASTGDMAEVPRRLPNDRTVTDMLAAAPTSFTAVSRSNYRRNYSVVRLAEGLYLMGSWRTTEQQVFSGVALPALAMPFLMWLAGIVVAHLAAHRLVARPISELRGAMADFAKGNRLVRQLELDGAAVEIVDLNHSYEEMTQIIIQDEAKLENLLRQKQMLLREVHHRTGNSLQLMASIIRMHLRQNPNDETQDMLTSLHERVMLLATVHLGLYQTADKTEVQMDTLIKRVTDQMVSLAQQSGRVLRIESQVDNLALGPDQAVPLSLLLAELLAGKSEAEGSQRAPVQVVLERVGNNQARLELTTPLHENDTSVVHASSARIGGLLVQGFSDQLGGKVNRKVVDGAESFTLQFTIREASNQSP